MKTIKFNTGRYYSTEGQIIEAEEHGSYDKYIDGLFDGKEVEQYIIFEDKTRLISGKIIFCRLNQDDIMRRYDAGDYTDF